MCRLFVDFMCNICSCIVDVQRCQRYADIPQYFSLTLSPRSQLHLTQASKFKIKFQFWSVGCSVLRCIFNKLFVFLSVHSRKNGRFFPGRQRAKLHSHAAFSNLHLNIFTPRPLVFFSTSIPYFSILLTIVHSLFDVDE